MGRTRHICFCFHLASINGTKKHEKDQELPGTKRRSSIGPQLARQALLGRP
jgi:hypothetical protein